MSYVDLNKYGFTTAADYSGLNPGNLTSVLSLSTIRVPYFELYRLMINTSAIPSAGNLPSIVQQTPLFNGSSLTSLTGAFPAAVTKGNLVVVGVSLLDSVDGANGAVSAMTLGASADNFGRVVTATGGDTGPSSFLWADPSAQQASTALAVTMTGGTGTNLAVGQGYEIAGMLATSSAATCFDAAASGTAVVNTSTGTKSAATSAGGTTVANEMLIGMGMGSAGSAWTLAPPGGNSVMASFVGRPAAGYFCNAAAAWSQLGAAGAAGAFGLSATAGANYWGLVSGAFLPSADAGGAEAFPFTVAIDGVTWDTQQTVAGVGYTYTLGQSPLYLNTGQTLQILWNGLDTATYLQYAQQFNITAWFRYDPSVQPST